ncbi:MAG: DinB family protein [Planctomycetes bacterium]|nr:DinB family protein [Planctomycetota bacterium]
MEPKLIIEQLELDGYRIRLLVEGVSPEQAHLKPNPESWSILEVINHLYDEEKEDFRAHLIFILNNPTGNWPSIDPQGWVTTRGYNQREVGQSLKNYQAERKISIDWLKTLDVSDWNEGVTAPWGGLITAGDMLSSWASHDLLHMRQFVELHHAYVLQLAAPYNVDYAGTW